MCQKRKSVKNSRVPYINIDNYLSCIDVAKARLRTWNWYFLNFNFKLIWTPAVKTYFERPEARFYFQAEYVNVFVPETWENRHCLNPHLSFSPASTLRLDFRRSLVSSLPSPRKSTGSFSEQQLVIEPSQHYNAVSVLKTFLYPQCARWSELDACATQ